MKTSRAEIAQVLSDYVDPIAGAKYAMGGAFEGAGRFDRSIALWNPPLLSADAELLPEKGTLDARVRDLRRNDGYVQTGQALHRDHIVGSTYMLNASPNVLALGLDETWAEEFQAEVENLFMLAAESEACWFDAARRNTFTGMIRLAVGVYATGGEVLATAEWIRQPGRPFKSAVLFVDADRLSTPDALLGDTTRRVRAGVEQDDFGGPIGYHIRDAHASDRDSALAAMNWTYVPASKPWGRAQVLHCLEQSRIDQSRGIADIVAGLKETRIAKKFRDVTLQQAVVAATYSASIESELPSEAVFQQLGAGNVSAGEAATSYAAEYLQAIAEYSSSAKNMQIDGVKIPHFFPGTKLQIRQPTTPAGVGQGFEQSLLRYLAAILGVSYEELSRDFTQTNYSSARAAMVQTWRFMMARKRVAADRVANFIYQLWFEEMFNAGRFTTIPRRAPSFYDPLMKEAYTSASWIGASRGQIDELKETQAAILRINNGLSTHEDEHAKLGRDWRKVYAQIAREQKAREALGIVLAQGNSVNAASGSPRDTTKADAPVEGDGGDE